MEGFSTIAGQLTILTKKIIEFRRSETYEKSFQGLKARLTSTPILTLPSGVGGYVIYFDAYRVGLGCVLM